MDLQKIYDMAIVKTWWKSTTLDKINQLRAELDLNTKATALNDNEYDKESVNALADIDFSPLGYSSNFFAWCVLNYAGIGFTAVDGTLQEGLSEDKELLGTDTDESLV